MLVYNKHLFLNMHGMNIKVTRLTLYFSVFHTGHKKEEEEFIYEFKLGKYRDKISICGLCRSYLWAKSEVLKTVECVTLHYRTV